MANAISKLIKQAYSKKCLFSKTLIIIKFVNNEIIHICALKTYTKLNGRVGFSLKIIIAILLRVCFMRKLTLNISNRPIPVLAVPYAKIISSN